MLVHPVYAPHLSTILSRCCEDDAMKALCLVSKGTNDVVLSFIKHQLSGSKVWVINMSGCLGLPNPLKCFWKVAHMSKVERIRFTNVGDAREIPSADFEDVLVGVKKLKEVTILPSSDHCNKGKSYVNRYRKLLCMLIDKDFSLTSLTCDVYFLDEDALPKLLLLRKSLLTLHIRMIPSCLLDWVASCRLLVDLEFWVPPLETDQFGEVGRRQAMGQVSNRIGKRTGIWQQ
jgi:hypothetical protein